MLSVDEALCAILRGCPTCAAETVGVHEAYGRVLAEDLSAQTAQPPFDASAMDGYAVRWSDARAGATLVVIGEARAGAERNLSVGEGEAVRIFTGGVVPRGADHVLLQEDVAVEGDTIAVHARQPAAGNIRRAGLDFQVGDTIIMKGRRLSAVDAALAAAANIAELPVYQRPRVAFFDNGEELVEPGARLKRGEIVGSNRFALAPLIAQWGGEPSYLGRARDDVPAVAGMFEHSGDSDIAVAIGGASVGDYDVVRRAFAACGGDLVFSKVAVKPGKPTWFGRLGATCVLGLPGNPASAIVCAVLFLRPLIAAMSGEPRIERGFRSRSLSASLPANGGREAYLRGHMDSHGRVAAFDDQDSSLLVPLARSACLIRRPAYAPVAPIGGLVECLDLH
jgi:molybdopterin molybdotransferase